MLHDHDKRQAILLAWGLCQGLPAALPLLIVLDTSMYVQGIIMVDDASEVDDSFHICLRDFICGVLEVFEVVVEIHRW